MDPIQGLRSRVECGYAVSLAAGPALGEAAQATEWIRGPQSTRRQGDNPSHAGYSAWKYNHQCTIFHNMGGIFEI